MNPETRTNITLGCGGGHRYSLQFPGALSDLLAWAGMERPVQVLTEGVRMHGLDLWQAAQHVVTGFVNKVYQGLTPYKLMPEVAMRVETYPDVTRPRPMYDRMRSVVKTVGGQPFGGSTTS